MAADSNSVSTKEELAVDTPQEPVNAFDLSPEQQDTASLLDRLFGKAIADRYVDRRGQGSREFGEFRPSFCDLGGRSARNRGYLVGRSAYWLDHDPSGLVEAGYGPATK
jgi:hypothetical protein